MSEPSPDEWDCSFRLGPVAGGWEYQVLVVEWPGSHLPDVR